ncbi:phage tail protein [Providencia alcalifaciens]|uniref:phage baseplate protein n=1 Tax=Providencia alcalifaciens TaxID=126385 RepID=UPI001CE17323|nr:phage tail protein [Providencia alcalifaciens]UBX48861.1 phage tail protein [Providencia alcalifaciens]
MSVIKKPDLKIFAQDAKTGEIESFPDILRGWGITLERTAGKPPLEWFNAIGKRVDEWLMYLTQRGVAEWDASLSYPKTAIVQFNSIVYVSVKETKGEQPDKSQASWSTLGLFLGLDKYSTTAAMNLELNKKFDKANISVTKGNDNDNVPSLGLFTAEIGKLQPKGNYQPAGDYATNTALTNGLNTKLNTSNVAQGTGSSTANVMSQKAVTDALQNAVNLNTIYPVGIVVWFAQNINPNNLFPNTKWQYIGENKTIRLASSSGNNVLSTGGSDSITLNASQMPVHNHSFSGTTASAGGHTHSRGTMNITGAFALGGGKSEGEAPGFVEGAFSKTTRTLKVNTASGTVNSSVSQVNLDASKTWSGDTSNSGAHTHTVTGTIGNAGSGSAITVTNAYIMLMGWYRIS